MSGDGVMTVDRSPPQVGDLLDRPWALQVAGGRLGHGFHAVDAPSEQSRRTSTTLRLVSGSSMTSARGWHRGYAPRPNRGSVEQHPCGCIRRW